MLEVIIRRLKHDRRGVSNVIVVMLSLILIVVIVANVVLWSYEMNQFDWERMQEKIEIINVRDVSIFSPWYVTHTEYHVDVGSKISGSHADTQSIGDDCWETFQEELTNPPPKYRLFLNGSFTIDIESYPLSIIQKVEVLLRYNASDSEEKWYLKTYNWTAQTYSDNGFNDTSGSQPSSSAAWTYYAVNLTSCWRSYVSDSGVMLIQFHDGTPENPSGTQTKISIDFLGVRVKGKGASFTFSNECPLTVHVVSLWVINSTYHKHYDVNFFVNPGENCTYARADIDLSASNFKIKIVTERGNIAMKVIS